MRSVVYQDYQVILGSGEIVNQEMTFEEVFKAHGTQTFHFQPRCKWKPSSYGQDFQDLVAELNQFSHKIYDLLYPEQDLTKGTRHNNNLPSHRGESETRKLLTASEGTCGNNKEEMKLTKGSGSGGEDYDGGDVVNSSSGGSGGSGGGTYENNPRRIKNFQQRRKLLVGDDRHRESMY
eukprot:TRINITY_DN10827_c0_g1_i2.p2 TRINITY_DN10827_c0_g1~~TRINITY_DN10827_c0_g1_i2.p2  ORF type:complete len:178 (+),score=46.34 TRINITY_DN10827_c0_g1_i2:782-1315(+)